jgi:hypothetical protein
MAYDTPFVNKPPYGSLKAAKAKTNPKQPDYYGGLAIDVSQFDIVDGVIQLSLSGWKKPSPTDGSTFLSLQASKPWVPDGMPAPAPKPVEEDPF